ncbi:hypothetical protein AMECASPLE_020489, partial [Ameca splendens]
SLCLSPDVFLMSPGSLWIFDNFFHRWHQSSWLQGDRLPTWTSRPSGWYPGFFSGGAFVLLDL